MMSHSVLAQCKRVTGTTVNISSMSTFLDNSKLNKTFQIICPFVKSIRCQLQMVLLSRSGTSSSYKRSSATRPASVPAHLFSSSGGGFLFLHPLPRLQAPDQRDETLVTWTNTQLGPRALSSGLVMSLSLPPLPTCPPLIATCRCCSSSCLRRCWSPAWMGRWERRGRAEAWPPPRPVTIARQPRSETWCPVKGGSWLPRLWLQVNKHKEIPLCSLIVTENGNELLYSCLCVYFRAVLFIKHTYK